MDGFVVDICVYLQATNLELVIDLHSHWISDWKGGGSGEGGVVKEEGRWRCWSLRGIGEVWAGGKVEEREGNAG